MPNPERFTASIKWSHADEISQLYFKAKGGDRVLTDADIALLGNFAGALNYARNQIEPPPPASTKVCQDFDFEMEIAWGDYTRYETRRQLQFGSIEVSPNVFADNHYVAGFVIPANATTFDSPGYFSVAEFGGDPWPRHLTLSDRPCDFRDPDPTGINGPLEVSYGKQATIYWNVGPGVGALNLKPGKKYYMNIRNFDPTVGSSNLAQGQIVNAGYSFIWPN